MTRLAVTGAGGFLGAAVLKCARLRDPRAVAIVRRLSDDLHEREADLRDERQVSGLLDGIDVVIHLAASKRGGFHDQYPSTVRATELLLEEAERAGVQRVILVSSFAVYDYCAIPAGTTVDENSPIDRVGRGRDAYTQVKVLQEEVASSWAATAACELTIARPGVVYGPSSWWSYRFGEQFGRLWLCFGSRAQVPMSYVDNCAAALVHLALDCANPVAVVNILDDDPPQQREVRRALKTLVRSRPTIVIVPWSVAELGVAALEIMNRRRKVPLRLPGFLVPESLAVRAKPLRYSNAVLRKTGWTPEVPLEVGLQRAVLGD